jgi:glycosyltransferase involved in cell wall biosynthesis
VTAGRQHEVPRPALEPGAHPERHTAVASVRLVRAVKVLLVIDHFGPGGAQRQLVELACGLKRRGHTVEIFVYFPQYTFLRGRLDELEIPVHEVSKEALGSIEVIRRLTALMRRGNFDVVVSFLNVANFYAEMAHLTVPRTRLIVSERTSFHDDRSPSTALLRRLLHVLADRVVANSETQARWLRSKWWLRPRVACIYNGVDLQKFEMQEFLPDAPNNLRLLGIGRIGPEKNLLTLVAGLKQFSDERGYLPQITWVGPQDESPRGRSYWEALSQALARFPELRARWRWLGLQANVAEILREHHALIHPSLYEGFPNAICEALAAGKPVLASDVCDHPLLVPDGTRGFLFDPESPESISAAIVRLASLSPGQWRTLGGNARSFAAENLGTSLMVGRYESLFDTMVFAR